MILKYIDILLFFAISNDWLHLASTLCYIEYQRSSLEKSAYHLLFSRLSDDIKHSSLLYGIVNCRKIFSIDDNAWQFFFTRLFPRILLPPDDE